MFEFLPNKSMIYMQGGLAMNYTNISTKRSVYDEDAYIVRRHKNRKRCRKQRHMLLGILAAILVLCSVSLLFHKTISSASTESMGEKCFLSVEIQPGDSLWSIASNYYTEQWNSIEDYIEEIKEFNGIYREDIRFGDYLMIPYYTD